MRRVRLAALAALFWTSLGAFFATQIRFLNPRVPWRIALAFSLPRWWVWGLLAPGVFWVDRLLSPTQSLARRVAWHVPLGIGFTLLSIVIRLLTRPLRGSPAPPNLTAFFLERFYWDLLIYAVIAGVAISRDYAAQVRERERQASELALQAADLERRLVEARLQTLRAQMQPHFLFNALNTISAFTETNPQMARRLMGQLGDLLRASLTHASRPLVTVGEELTFLDDYLAIESARLEGRVRISVRADDDVLGAMVPGFLLQPLVENAIRHGVAPRLAGGSVDVSVTRDGSILKLRVRDNGVGLRAGWDFPRDAGVGLRNVAARLEHLYGGRDLMRIVPLASSGVEVEIDLPMRHAAPQAGALDAARAGALDTARVTAAREIASAGG